MAWPFRVQHNLHPYSSNTIFLPQGAHATHPPSGHKTAALRLDRQACILIPQAVLPHLSTGPTILPRQLDIPCVNRIPVDVPYRAGEHPRRTHDLSAKRALPEGIPVEADLVGEGRNLFRLQQRKNPGRSADLQRSHERSWPSVSRHPNHQVDVVRHHHEGMENGPHPPTLGDDGRLHGVARRLAGEGVDEVQDRSSCKDTISRPTPIHPMPLSSRTNMIKG